MLAANFEFALVDQERGTRYVPFLPQTATKKSDWSVKATFNPLNLASSSLRRSQITYVTGREDFIVCLTSHGSVFVSSSLLSSRILTKNGERAIKIMQNSLELFMAVKKASEDFLRFYRVSLVEPLFKRQRLLKHTRFSPSDLKKVDSVHKVLVLGRNGRTEIWDLDSESSLFVSEVGKKVWYSKFTVIQTETTDDGTLISITPLNSFVQKVIKMKQLFEVFQVEKIGQKLVIGSRSSPAQVVDLDKRTCEVLSTSPPKFYMETEHMMDAFIVFYDGSGIFAQNPQGNLHVQCRDPIFTDTSEQLVVVDEHTVSVFSHQSAVHTDISFGKNVTCVGMNDDTGEIYLGQKNGCITILH